MKQVNVIFPSVSHRIDEVEDKEGVPGFRVTMFTNVVKFNQSRTEAYVVPNLGQHYWLPKSTFTNGGSEPDIHSIPVRDLRQILSQFSEFVNKVIPHIEWSKATTCEFVDGKIIAPSHAEKDED